MYNRLLESVLREGRRSVLLLGPRQVGKSTLLAGLGPDLTINLADPSSYRDYVTYPERLSEDLRAASPATRTVFIDEVQRVPELLDVVQVWLDDHPRRFRFLLSGSSARKLRRGKANLLPGRIHVHYLHPLVASELADDFDLERCLAHGTLPGIYAEDDPGSRERTLRTYADVYLREEIQAEALVRDVGGYSRMLDLVAASSGRVINLSALSRDAGVRYETARRYLGVLEDTLVAFAVPAWRRSDRATLVAHPRFYMFDLGVRNSLLGRRLDRVLPDERGILLEHFVAYEIYRRTTDVWPTARLFHFRTKHGAEVDFVLEVDGELWGIECKASRRVATAELKGFVALENHSGDLKRKLVVHLGPRRSMVGDVEAIPLGDFIESLPL